MPHDPISHFHELWKTASKNTPLRQKNAVCVSTINSDGFPEGRFVDLKEVDNNGFVFCSYLDSNKGKHILKNPKASMTIWWDHVGLQVRVVGYAHQISKQSADKYWHGRSKSAQIATTCFAQSTPIDSEDQITKQFEEAMKEYESTSVPKPDAWGGYSISPSSIEILTFRENRLHLREFYKRQTDEWDLTLLQP